MFDQLNMFKAIHDHTKIGGLMIHWTPTLGWVNHGMYNLQSASIFDLSAANGYRIEHAELGTANEFFVLEKRMG